VRHVQALHEELLANPPQATAPVAAAVPASPTASSGSGGNQPADPGWEDRILSAVNSPAGTMSSHPPASQFWSSEQLHGGVSAPTAAGAADSLQRSSLLSQSSLQKLESGVLPRVFNTQESFELPAGFSAGPAPGVGRSQEQRNPVQAALAAQAIAAQVRLSTYHCFFHSFALLPCCPLRFIQNKRQWVYGRYKISAGHLHMEHSS